VNLPEWISAIVAAISLVAIAIGAHLISQIKLALAQFENTFVDRLNGRYIRKPDNEEDYPVTRREIELIEKTSAAEHARLEAGIKELHGRISAGRS
jgi:hypothetical protein